MINFQDTEIEDLKKQLYIAIGVLGGVVVLILILVLALALSISRYVQSRFIITKYRPGQANLHCHQK